MIDPAPAPGSNGGSRAAQARGRDGAGARGRGLAPRGSEVAPLVLHGNGGHAAVLRDAALALGIPLLGYLDDAKVPASEIRNPKSEIPFPRLRGDDPRLASAAHIVAIGDNAARRRILHRLIAEGRTVINLIHPTAVVSPGAALGRGIYIGANAVVNAHATLADGVIVNTAAVVEHHCALGECVHIAPGSVLAGGVTVGELTLIGVGGRVVPRVVVGRGCVVGAGGVVVADLADDGTYVGSPARRVK